MKKVNISLLLGFDLLDKIFNDQNLSSDEKQVLLHYIYEIIYDKYMLGLINYEVMDLFFKRNKRIYKVQLGWTKPKCKTDNTLNWVADDIISSAFYIQERKKYVRKQL